jgi:hypothetical protein
MLTGDKFRLDVGAAVGVASVPPPPQEAENITSAYRVARRIAKLTHCFCSLWVRILVQLSMKVLRSCVIGRTSLPPFPEVEGITLACQLVPWGPTLTMVSSRCCEVDYH